MQKTTHLLFLDRFKDLDNAFLIVGNIYTLKHFTVFSPSNFPNNLIVILFAEYKKCEMKILGNVHLKKKCKSHKLNINYTGEKTHGLRENNSALIPSILLQSKGILYKTVDMVVAPTIIYKDNIAKNGLFLTLSFLSLFMQIQTYPDIYPINKFYSQGQFQLISQTREQEPLPD